MGFDEMGSLLGAWMRELAGADLPVTCLRLGLALLCGGLLGYERGRKKRPAGFRTYMMVCLGATLVMMTNEYICRTWNTGDPARMAAQVISGIGFLGAGTIIVTGRNRVKGLTTAAGLWAAACIGLAIGIGYYAGAIIGCAMMFLVMSVLHNVDERVSAVTPVLDLYVEFERLSDVRSFITFTREHDMKVSELRVTRPETGEEHGIAAMMTLRLPRKQPHTTLMDMLQTVEGVRFVEEM